MDSKLPQIEEEHSASVDGQYRCDTQLRTRKAGRRRKKPKEVKRPVGQALAIVVRHCFPDFWNRLEAIEDPRDTDKLRYPLTQVLCLCTLMFACRVSSRRELDRISHNVLFRDNLCLFSGKQTETVMVSEQMVNVLKKLDPHALAAVQPELVRNLVEKKRLQEAYVLGHLAVCSDGTGIFSSSSYHCDECLTQNHDDGKIIYMHNMLEAKVLCANGMAISLMSEPVKNRADGCYEKQDCETKAFKRLVPRIKQTFPRQPFVHLLDSLYAQAPVFKLLEQCKHQFICNFKRGSIPTLYDESIELLKFVPENKLSVRTTIGDKGEVRQTIRWLDNLEYKGMTLGFVRCEQVDKQGEVSVYTWLTSFTITKHNVQEIARAGRMRWKIENEGFNEQKNGYKMEHFCNCNDFNVMLCLYLILQIAHMFMQLLAKSNLLDEPVQVLKHLAYLLLESMRNHLLPRAVPDQDLPQMQIRFAKAPT
jgi:hypothetical protein